MQKVRRDCEITLNQNILRRFCFFTEVFGKQFSEVICILDQFTLQKINMNESIVVSSVIGKLPPSWKDTTVH